ncbi:hypothetical protein ABEF95_013168 [Exophiala dermatitidis]
MDPLSKVEDEPPYQVLNFLHCEDIDSLFQVVCRGRRFHVSVSPSDFREGDSTESSTPPSSASSHIEDQYQRLLAAVRDDDPSNIEDLNPEGYHPLDVLYDWIATPFFPLFRKIPPLHNIGSGPGQRLQNLDEYANPPTQFFRLKCVEGRVTPIRLIDGEHDVVPRPLLRFLDLSPSCIRSNVPIFSSREILIPWDSLSEGALYPQAVFLHGHHKLYLRSAMDSRSAEREIDHLLRIQDSGLHNMLLLPKLHGYVEDASQKRIIGYLLEYIEHRGTLDHVGAAEKAPLALRRRWYQKIAETLSALHDVGIVWGDAKAGNVLVDHEDSVWVIDFGGGYTVGWVDEELRETVAGDLQGLARIKEYLKLTEDGVLDTYESG